jgi:hypothetical protein
MAIEGLRSPDVPAPAVLPTINVNDRALLAIQTLQAMNRLEGDPEATLEGIRDEFGQIESRGLIGETCVPPNLGSEFTPTRMLKLVDTAPYPGDRQYPITYPLEEGARNISRRLWLPADSSREGYSIAEINRQDIVEAGADEPALRPVRAQLVLATGEHSEEPLLRLTGMPYDDMYAEKGQTTQLEQFAADKAQFEENNAGLELTPANLAVLVTLAVQRRIEGKPMPLQWGFARILQLGRKVVDGYSYVGVVYSDGGRLRLDGSYGSAIPYGGVVFSVGLKEVEPQAS